MLHWTDRCDGHSVEKDNGQRSQARGDRGHPLPKPAAMFTANHTQWTNPIRKMAMTNAETFDTSRGRVKSGNAMDIRSICITFIS